VHGRPEIRGGNARHERPQDHLGLAAGVDLEGRRGQEPWVQLQGGYAFGSKEFRYSGVLRLPLGPEAWGFDAQLQFEDRVVPYGSNRPLWNGLRAFVGGEDARDYMGRLGGSAFLHWRRWRSLQLSVGYEAAEESSVEATTEFALLGKMAPNNLPIEDGTDRAVVGTLRLGSLVHHLARLDVEHRVAGGGNKLMVLMSQAVQPGVVRHLLRKLAEMDGILRVREATVINVAN